MRSPIPLLFLPLLPLLTAQTLNEIPDGQIQNQLSTPAITPPSIIETASTIEETATSTLPCKSSASLPGPRVPLYTGNATLLATGTASGTGLLGGLGNNASAPTVPAVPSAIGGGASATSGGPSEAGTSAAGVASSGAEGMRGMGMVVVVVVGIVGGWAAVM